MEETRTPGRRRTPGFALIALLLASPIGLCQVPARFNELMPAPGRSFLMALVYERLHANPGAAPLPDEDALERETLIDPGSLYPMPRPMRPEAAGPAWERAMEHMANAGFPMVTAQAEWWYRWELGLTRALPDKDVPHIPGQATMAAAWIMGNIAKAGIELNIARKARELVGEHDAALAATLAVSVQLLREQETAAGHPGNQYAGHWGEPLVRFGQAGTLAALRDEDLTYLMRLLENELSSWRERPLSIYGAPALPVAVRVARMAAAYRSMEYTSPPCNDDGLPRSVDASGSDTPLCFAAMTDRAVLAWYNATLFDDLAAYDADPDAVPQVMRDLATAVSRVQPGWIGVFEPVARRSALDTPVVTAGIARELRRTALVSSAMTRRLDDVALERMCVGATP